MQSRDFFRSDSTILSILLVLSLVFPLLFFQEGFFSPDEREYTYLAQNLVAHQSLDVSHRFPAWEETYSSLALPRGFLVSPHDAAVVHAVCFFGYSLFAAPLVAVVGANGLILFNVLLTAVSVVLVYLVAQRVWSQQDVAFISALLYLLASPALFYATSYWYHPLINGSFLACVYLFVIGSRPRDDFLFFIAAGVCLWTAYYMIVPLSVLALARAHRESSGYGRLGILFVFGALLLPTVIYNELVYDAMFTGYLGGLLPPSQDTVSRSVLGLVWHGGTLVFFGVMGFFVCRICTALAYPDFSYLQKALLESSPHLIAAVPGYLLARERLAAPRWRAVLIAHLLYAAMVVWGKTNSFGGWTLTARYMLPVVPLLVVLAAGYLARVCQSRWIAFVIAASFIGSLLVALPDDPAIVWGTQSGTSLVLLSFTLFFFLISRLHPNSNPFLLSLVFYLAVGAGVMNSVFDARLGMAVRAHSGQLSSAVASVIPAGAAVFIPQTLYFDFADYSHHHVYWYPPASDPYQNATHDASVAEMAAVIDHYLARGTAVYVLADHDTLIKASVSPQLSDRYLFEKRGIIDTRFLHSPFYQLSGKGEDQRTRQYFL